MENVIYSETAANSKFRQFSFEGRSWVFEKFYLPRLKELEIFTPHSRFAEIGCGYGDKMATMLPHLAEDSSIIGVDNSPGMLNIARKKYPSCNFILADARTLSPLEDNSFEGLFYFQMLHHLSLEDIQNSFSTAWKKLKPQGKMAMIITFNPRFFLKKMFFRAMEGEYTIASSIANSSLGNEAYRFPTREEIFSVANTCGFRPIFETGPKMPYVISEMMVFEKIDSSTGMEDSFV